MPRQKKGRRAKGDVTPESQAHNGVATERWTRRGGIGDRAWDAGGKNIDILIYEYIVYTDLCVYT